VNDDEIKKLRERYEQLIAHHQADSHAMQSGVGLLMAKDYGLDADRQPANFMKHLRVGVNVALTDHASLVALLIRKDLITDMEYVEAIADGMRAERERFEEAVRVAYGNPNITLG